ncbi:MAG: alpha/beta fold hydrolase [Tepidiformaceae bacterium]
MRRVNVAGMDVAYEERGDGPPLVFLHGFLSDHRDWLPQLDGLSDEFRVIAWEAPGCGLSPDPPETWRFAEYVDCLATFLDALGIDNAHILGLSWGGTLAQDFYRHHAGRVRSLVLADTYTGWLASLGEQAGRERLELCLRLSTGPPADLVGSLIGGMFSPAASPTTIGELATIMADFHPSGFRTMSHAVAEVDTRDVWPSITVPTLLIWGRDDARSALSVAEEFQAGIPHSQLAVIPGGHVSNMESPEAFNDAVRDFIRAVEAAKVQSAS